MIDHLMADLRKGLPDHLTVLLKDYPKQDWRQHKNFSSLVEFWLDRHLMFRKALTTLQSETEFFLDGARDSKKFSRLIGQVGGFLINELHAHHQIEDNYFFPILAQQDSRLTTGFELLDSDHHLLDDKLERTQISGQNLITKIQNRSDASLQAADSLLGTLNGLNSLLDRHLIDEEELIVPIILAYKPDLG